MKPLDSIIARIGKLLRLAGNNSSAAEAAAAMAKAQQLAAEHGISLTEIPDGTDTTSAITHSETKCRKDIASRCASYLVKTHFGVECQFMTCNRRTVIQIVGMPSQVQIATYVFTYLSRAMVAAWAHRENRRLRDRESFIRAFAIGVSDKLPAVYPQTGLILSTGDYLKSHLTPEGAIVKDAPALKSSISAAAAMAGHTAGKQTELRQAIRGTSQELLDF